MDRGAMMPIPAPDPSAKCKDFPRIGFGSFGVCLSIPIPWVALRLPGAIIILPLPAGLPAGGMAGSEKRINTPPPLIPPPKGDNVIS